MGKFADSDDVIGRFEGGATNFPAGRDDWLEIRIGDVENALMGLVPSLRKSVDDITADSVRVGDPDRLQRVKTLIADKVLDLFRNPDPRLSQMTQTMEQDSVSRAYSRNPNRSGTVTISFTDEELAGVKLYKRRSKIRSIPILPFKPCY